MKAILLILAFLLPTGCIFVDKRVLVYSNGDAKVTVENTSDTKADGNTLDAKPSVSIPITGGGVP